MIDPNDYYKFEKEEELLVYASGDSEDPSEHFQACLKYEEEKRKRRARLGIEEIKKERFLAKKISLEEIASDINKKIGKKVAWIGEKKK